MGRRRRLTPTTSPVTTIRVTLETLDFIYQFKSRKETQDHFIRRIFEEWNDRKEVIEIQEKTCEYQAKRLEEYEKEFERLNRLLEIQQKQELR